MSKGISEVATAALYVGITVSAISAALTVGVPALENLQQASAVTNARTFMQELDSAVEEVAAEGRGSSRTLEVSLDDGRIFFDEEANALVYQINTDAEVISPQSSRRVGNVILSSNANVEVYNVTSSGDYDFSYDGPDCYMMENEHSRVCIRQVGSPDSQEDIDTSDLLTYYEFKDRSRTLDANLTVELNEIDASSYGEGYTEVREFGKYIGTGQVRARVVSDSGYTYDMIFSLPSGADFIQVDVQNFN